MNQAKSFAASPQLAGYRDIDPQELNAHAGALLVDVREPDEFEGDLCHVPGSVLAPLGELATRADGWPRNRPVVVVCRSGRRSARGAELLVALGFEQVFNLRGGMQAYRGVGLPTECGPCPR